MAFVLERLRIEYCYYWSWGMFIILLCVVTNWLVRCVVIEIATTWPIYFNILFPIIVSPRRRVETAVYVLSFPISNSNWTLFPLPVWILLKVIMNFENTEELFVWLLIWKHMPSIMSGLFDYSCQFQPKWNDESTLFNAYNIIIPLQHAIARICKFHRNCRELE